jgi:hypothetical protein
VAFELPLIDSTSELRTPAGSAPLQWIRPHTQNSASFGVDANFAESPRRLSMASIDSVFQSLSAALAEASDVRHIADDRSLESLHSQDHESDEHDTRLADNVFQNLARNGWRLFQSS